MSYINTEALPQIESKRGDALLTTFVQQWNNFLLFSRMVDKMFDYLNRYYLKNQSLR